MLLKTTFYILVPKYNAASYQHIYSLYLVDIVRAIWPYSTNLIADYFKQNRKYKDGKRDAHTLTSLKTAAKNLEPYARKLLADVQSKEAEQAQLKYKENKQLFLMSKPKVATHMKALSYPLKQLEHILQ